MKLTAKDVRIGIKIGMTIEDFCTKYECTEKDFKERIKKLYTYDKSFSKVWNEILANKKKARKAASPEEEPVWDRPEERTSASEDFHNISYEVEPSRKEQLQALESEISDTSDQLVQKELERKALISEHREKIATIKKVAKRVDKLLANIAAEYEVFTSLTKECDENTMKQSEVWAEIVVLKEKLEASRAEAARLSVVEVVLYKDGHFESSDETDFETIRESTFLFEKLLHDESCSNFTVAEIRNLTKLIEFANRSEFEVIVTCDNDELEKVFNRFRADAAYSPKNHLN